MSLNVGIELELEDTRPNYATRGWRAEHDGTLRGGGGIEFLMAGKQPLNTAKRMVRSLLANLDGNYTISHRCSTHVHVDTQGLNGYAKVSMLLGLMIHDRFFYQYGEGRERNSFCCPVLYTPSAALMTINQAVRANDWTPRGELRELSTRRQVPSLSRTNTKYMSINTMPMNNIGTIELRHFSPVVNPVDMDAILDKIAAIYERAATVGSSGRNAARDVWTGFDPDYTDEIRWAQGMYDLHNLMVGE